MRWLESGGAGGGTKMPLVRKLLMALLCAFAGIQEICFESISHDLVLKSRKAV